MRILSRGSQLSRAVPSLRSRFCFFLYLYKLYHNYYIGIVRFVTIYLFVLIVEVIPSLAVSEQINTDK
jgi:hypothetical protein